MRFFAPFLFCFVLLSLALPALKADLYLQNPHGSCNRLRDNNEQNNRNRDNGNRLFDSQDNNRGGYEAPTFGSGIQYFYEQSVLYVEWTAQHACASPEAQCDFILQYMCDNSGLVRDGTNAAIQGATGTIPNDPTQCTNGDCDGDLRYGRHESWYYYQNCMYTKYNGGLFHADQNVVQQGNAQDGNIGSAIHTRQNPNGNRHGYECPEERDYYPYWRPSPWKDIAIVTNTPAKCADWQAKSQNRAAKFQCTYPNGLPTTQQTTANNGYAFIPITQMECEGPVTAPTGGVWTSIPAWGIPAPECVYGGDKVPWMVDNNLGNAVGGQAYNYNWTIPSDYAENCVFRIRYNISTSDHNFNPQTGAMSYQWTLNGNPNVDHPARSQYISGSEAFGYQSESSTEAGYLTSAYDAINNNNGNNGVNYPSKWPMWKVFGIPLSDMIDPNYATSGYPNQNAVTAPKATRGYNYQDNPVVDIFGPLIHSASGGNITFLQQRSQNTRGNSGNNPRYYTSAVGLRLAIDTSQLFRTFQDRSYIFAIRQRPPQLMGFKIHNVNVRGKRGNIVQVYPSVEHDFAPNQLVIQNGDLVHFQWQGSEYNNNQNAGPPNGNGNDAGSTYDRNNVIVLRNANDKTNPWAQIFTTSNLAPYGWSGEPNVDTVNTVGHWGNNVPGRIDDPVHYPFLGFGYIDLNALAFGGLNSSYFDLGPRQVFREGVYRYQATTNNNFSNRSQKGMITVLPASGPIEVANWGAGAFAQSNVQNSNNNAYTAGAYLSSQYLADGTPITQQEVWIQAFDNSGYDTPWIWVQPANISINLIAQNADPNGVGLYLYIPHSFRVLTSPTVYYKINATTTNLWTVSGTSDDGYRTKIPVGGTVPDPWGMQMMARPNQGGYYTVALTVDAGKIAIIIVSVLGAIAIFVFLYWKVRIQPAGGFQAWLREKKALYDKSSHTRLVGESATQSEQSTQA